MYVYYAKFNINSDLKKIKKDSKKLEDILKDLANKINIHSRDYKYIYKYEYSIEQDEVDEYGNVIKKKIVEEEVYRFINTDLIEESHGEVIIGELIREKPDAINVYNDETHEIEETGISKRVFGTYFVFDLQSEVIAFTERRGLGRKQFINAFEKLSFEMLGDKAVKIYLKQDPGSFEKKVKSLTRVNEINVEIISPNFVDKELDEMEAEAKRLGEEMDEQNVTKMQYNIEASNENKKGVDLNGNLAKEILGKFSIMSMLGYAKSKVTGMIGSSNKIINSEKDAPYVTMINHKDREDNTEFKQHVLRGITQEAARKTIESERKKGENIESDDLDE